jgi:hypothetical protein
MFALRLPKLSTTAALAVSLLALSCGSDAPSGPNTPTPTPPAPTAPPPGGGVGASCPLGKGTNSFSCDRRSPRLLAQVEAALDQLVKERPQIFDLQDEFQPGTRAYRVLDEKAYFDGIVANLVATGLCAERDVDDPFQQTVFVKSSNDYSEEYDLVLSSGHVRRGIGAYRTTCSPAAFPVERAADAPPIGSGCFRPYPPPIARFNCKVHLKGDGFELLDSTPLVNDVFYCAAIGYSDGRGICPIRPEGTPDRAACENWRVGKAEDTGRPGPTWRKADGSFCTGEASGCANSPDNQYQLRAFRPGKYTVSSQNGVSCTVDVD